MTVVSYTPCYKPLPVSQSHNYRFPNPNDSEILKEIEDWCCEHIGPQYLTWYSSKYKIWIYKEQDYIAFILRWV